MSHTGGEGGSEGPSEYCDVLGEEVLMPLTEAALTLEARPQSVFMTLSATIFFTEYRRAILSNKHTYRLASSSSGFFGDVGLSICFVI